MSFSPTDINGLHFWLDADDATTLTVDATSKKVSEWRDKVAGSPRKMERITYNNGDKYYEFRTAWFQDRNNNSLSRDDYYANNTEEAWNYAFDAETKDNFTYEIDNTDISKNIVRFGGGMAVFNGGNNARLFNDVSNSSGVTISMLIKVRGRSASPFNNVFSTATNVDDSRGVNHRLFDNNGIIQDLSGRNIIRTKQNVYSYNRWYVYTICGNPSFAPNKTLFYLNGYLINQTEYDPTYIKSPYMAGMVVYEYDERWYRNGRGQDSNYILIRERIPVIVNIAEILAYRNTSTTDRFTYDNLVSVHNYLFNKWFSLRNYPVYKPNNLVTSTLFKVPSNFGTSSILNKIIGSGFTLKDSNNNTIFENQTSINDSLISSLDPNSIYQLSYTQNGIVSTLNFRIVNLLDPLTTLSKGAKIKFINSSFLVSKFKTNNATFQTLNLTPYWDTSMNVNIVSDNDTFLVSSTSPRQIKFRLENNVDSEIVTSNIIDYIIIPEEYIVIKNIGDSATLQLPASSMSTIETYLGSSITTYQWLFNNNILNGQTSSTLNISNSQVQDKGDYSLNVTYGSENTIIDTNKLEVIEPTSINTAAINVTTTNGTFSASIPAVPGATYEWFTDSDNLAFQAHPYEFAGTATAAGVTPVKTSTNNNVSSPTTTNPRTSIASLTDNTGKYTIRSSNDYRDGGYSGWKALNTDSIPGSADDWAINGASFAPGNSWWSLEFPTQVKICRFDVGTRGGNALSSTMAHYIFQGANGNADLTFTDVSNLTWTDIYEVVGQKADGNGKSLVVNIPIERRATYRYYRFLLTAANNSTSLLSGTTNTYTSFTTGGDVGMGWCKLYKTDSSLKDISGFSGQATNTLTGDISRANRITSSTNTIPTGRYYPRITGAGSSINAIPAYFGYNLMNERQRVDLTNSIDTTNLTGATHNWLLNGTTVATNAKALTAQALTLPTSNPIVYVNRMSYASKTYDQHVYVADIIKNLDSSSNPVKTSVTLQIADISLATYQWYAGNAAATGAGNATRTYTTDVKNNYHVSVTKYGITKYSNIAAIDTTSPLTISHIGLPLQAEPIIVKNPTLPSSPFAPPLRILNMSNQGHMLFGDASANLFVSGRNFITNYRPDNVTIYQIPLPSSAGLFANITWNSVQFANYNDQDSVVVKCKNSATNIQFLTRYTIGNFVDISSTFAGSSLTADDDTTNSTSFACSGNGRWIYWKYSTTAFYVYDMASASPTTAVANITFSGAVKSISTTYDGSLLCLTLTGETASTAGYKIYKPTNEARTSWTDHTTFYSAIDTSSMTFQILNKVSNRTTVNTASPTFANFSPALLQYSLASTTDGKTLFLYMPDYVTLTGNYRGVMAVFNYDGSNPPVLRYFFCPETFGRLTSFSLNSANPYFVNDRYVYKIPSYYMSKVSTTTGQDISGVALSPIVQIRNKLDISSNFPVPGLTATTVATVPPIISYNGDKIIFFSRTHQLAGITKQLGTFMFFDLSRNTLAPQLPSSITLAQNERGEQITRRHIPRDFFTSTYVDTSNTYIFVKTKNNQGSINTVRNSARNDTTTYTTDTTQGKVGDWRIALTSTSNYPLDSASWYSLKTDVSQNYYFGVGAGVNYDSDKNSSDTAIQLEYFVDPEVVAVRNDVSNAVVVFPDNSFPALFEKNTASVTVTNITQQPDRINTQNPIIATPSALHDISNAGGSTRLTYKGYPTILKNTLISQDARYVFDTDDLIRWFNPSISKEYKTPDISYEYGWAVRVTRSSVSTDVAGTWGWQVSADGGTVWKTLMSVKSPDTYFFRNKVPGTTNTKYKFRYIDDSGSPQLGAALNSKYLNDFLVLPWNEENEDITGTYFRDERDYSTPRYRPDGITNNTSPAGNYYYKPVSGYYIGKLYDGSGNNVADNGLFSTRAGIVRVDISGSTKPVLTSRGPYTFPYELIDNDLNARSMSVTEMLYGSGENKLFNLGTEPGAGINVYTPDISSNQRVLGLAIDLNSVNTGVRGKWQYRTTSSGNWSDMTSNSSNVLVLWSRNITDRENSIRFNPAVGKRDTDDYETLGFYIYDGSDVTIDHNNNINAATNKNGTINTTLTSLKPALSDISGVLRVFVNKFNFSPELENPVDYNIEYKYNSSTYTVNGKPYTVPVQNTLNIPLSDLTSHYIPRDAEINTMGLAIGDISNVPLIAGEADVSNSYYGPYNLGDSYKLDISNGLYASFTDVSSAPTLYSISSVSTTNLDVWFDFNNYKDMLLDTTKKASYVPNRVAAARNLAQSNAANQPTYEIDRQGFKGLRFNGAQWIDICGGMLINGTNQTFIVVERRGASGRMPLLGGDNSAATVRDLSSIEFGYTADGSGVLFSAEGSTASSALTCNSTNVVNTFTNTALEPIRIWTYQYDHQINNATKVVRIYLNDQLVATTSITGSAASAFSGITKPTLGRLLKGTTATYYTGTIYEVAYYNTTVAAATLTSLQQNLMQKYGLLDTTTFLRHGLQAWYDFSNPLNITYDADTKAVTRVQNQYKHIADLSLNALASVGPIYTAPNAAVNTFAAFNGAKEFTLPANIVPYFTAANATKSYTLIIVDTRDETYAGQASGFLGDSAGASFYIGYDASQNMVIRTGTGEANILRVSSLNITYNATRVWTFTYDAATNRYEIYMNSFKLGSKIMTPPVSWTGTTVLGRGYVGTISEIALYNVVLSYSSALSTILNNLYKKWIQPAFNAAQTEALRCYGWYDVTDTALLDLSSSDTTISRIRSRNLLQDAYTLTQTTEANKPRYNATESAIQFVNSAATRFIMNGVSNATDSDRSYTIFIVEKRSALFDSSGTYLAGSIIGNQLNFGYLNSTDLQCNSYTIPLAVLPFNAASEPRRLWTLSYDSISRKTRIYLNNELIFNKTDAAGALAWTTRLIGALNTTAPTQYYNGLVYEMMFFNDPNPPFLAALQTKLMSKWAIDVPYSNTATVCWIDANDTRSLTLDPTGRGTQVIGLKCKNTGAQLFGQTTALNRPVVQTNAEENILGKRAVYFSGTTFMSDISSAFTSRFVGAATSYTLVFVERRTSTTTATNTVFGGTGFGIYFDVNGSTPRFNCTIGSTTYTTNLVTNYNYVDLPTSVWTISYNAANRTLVVHQNMTRVAVFTGVAAATSWTGASFGNVFNGYIGELMLFSSATVANLTDIQERLIEKWVTDSMDNYRKFNSVMAWYDIADASGCLDLSGTTGTVYGLVNRNAFNGDMNFVQQTAANCPSYNASSSSITLGANQFMMMSPYLRDQMLTASTTTTVPAPRSFTLMFVEKRNASGAHNFLGDTNALGLNVGYTSTDASGVFVNTGTLRHMEYAAPYVAASEGKKLWTFAFLYNPTSANNVRCNVYLNNVFIGYTTTNNNLTAWANPCLGRHLASYSNFELYEMLYIRDGSISNLTAVQEALLDKHGITYYSVPALSASRAITISDVNTGLVAWYDSADSSAITNRVVSGATIVTDISSVANKVTANPTYRLDISSVVNSFPTIGNIVNDISGFIFASPKFIRMSADMSGLFVNTNYTLVIVERRSAATANYVLGSPAANRLAIGYSTQNNFIITHSGGSVNVPVASFTATSQDEPMRIWTIAYNNTAQTVDVYYGNQRVTTGAALAQNTSSAELTIGRSVATYYSGTLYEMLIYNSYVNDAATLRKLQERLMSKWEVRLQTHYSTTYIEPSYYFQNSLVGWFDAAALMTETGTVAVREIPNRISKYAPYFTLTQGTAANRPTLVPGAVNGRNVVRFSRASSQYMDISSVDSTGVRFGNLFKGSYTLIIVEKPATDASGTLNPFIGGNNSTKTVLNNVCVGYSSTSNAFVMSTVNNAAVPAASATYTKVFSNAYSGTYGQPRIWTIRHTSGGAAFALYLNGNLVEEVSSGGTLGTIAALTGLSFGRHVVNKSATATPDNVTTYYSGDLCEMMLFNTNSVSDIDKYHKYLMDKWGIPFATYYPNNNGLVAWFDMNDRSTMSVGSSFISQVNNKLTNNPQYFFTNMGNRASRPRYVGGAVNSLNALQFNATASSTQFMGLSTELAKLLLADDFTLMVVEKRTADCSGRPFFGGSSATPANNVVIGYGVVTTGTSQTFGLTTSGTYTNTSSLNFVDISNEQARIWTFEASKSGNKMNIYHNGIPFYANTSFTPSTSWLDPYLGRNLSNYYNGYICEIMIFKTASLANRNNYETYLYNKWVGEFGSSYTNDYAGGGVVSITRWFDLTDKTLIKHDTNNNVTNIYSKFIQHLPSQTGAVGSLIPPSGSTGPKFIYNGLGKINASDFSGNSLTFNNVVSGESFEALLIVVERPRLISGISNTIMSSSGGGAGWGMGYNLTGNPYAYFSVLSTGALAQTQTYNSYKLKEIETPHVWMFTTGIYKNDPKVSCYFDGQAIISPTTLAEGDNDANKQFLLSNFRIGANSYNGHIYEVLIGTFTQAANLDTNYISRFSKYLINKWSVVKPSLTIPIRQNQTQRITMNVAAWDTYKRMTTLPTSRLVNSSYSDQLANLKITIYNQNRAPELKFEDATSLLTEGDNTVRVFDLTKIPSNNPIGIFENKLKNAENNDIPGKFTITIDSLFQSTLLSNYIEKDTRDEKGIALIGLNKTRGTWYLYNTATPNELTDLNELAISNINALLLKQNTGYALRYDVSSTFMTTPHEISFDILAWDTTDQRYTEGTTIDLTEDGYTPTSSYSDPTKIYRYTIKSRPYIESSALVSFQIKYDATKKEVSTEQPQTLTDIIVPEGRSSPFKISTSLALAGNEYYITGFRNTTSKGASLSMEYQRPNGTWTDLSASDLTPVLASYPLRLRADTIPTDVTETGVKFEISIKVKDKNVGFFSSQAALIEMTVTEVNVAPTLKYRSTLELEHTFPVIYNTIETDSADIPIIDISNDLIWEDNNFSRIYRQQAYAIEIINSQNGNWRLINTDPENVTDELLTGLAQGQRKLIGPNYKIKYVPTSASNGDAIVNIYAWDKGNGDADIGDTVDRNTDSTYPVGLFSDSPVKITVPIISPNNAPVFENGTTTTFAYTLTAQDDNNTNTKGNTIDNIIESIIGSDYRDIAVGNSPVLKGLAVIGSSAVAAYGKWQYTVNGTVWTDLSGTYSDGRALHLASDTTTAVRFNFTKTSAYLNSYTAPSLTVRAWDQNNQLANGTVAAIERTGGTTSYSVATATLSCPISHVNHAPRLSATGIVINRTMDGKAPHVIDISGIIAELGARYIEDDTEQTERGIAVVDISNVLTRDVTGNLGTWKVGADELNVTFGPYVALRDSAAQIQFTAEQFNTGRTTLTMKLYDGTTSYSERTFNYVLELTDTNYAPYYNEPITEKSYSATLFGTSFDISVNTLVRDLSGTDYNGNVLGVVLYESEPVSAYNPQVGQLSYRDVGQSSFTPVLFSKLSTAAYHLSSAATIRYTPVLNREGVSISINVLLWDRSNVASIPSTYTAVPSSSRGGFGAYSTDGVQLTFTNTKQNYAPEISGSTIKLESLTINSTPTSYSVTDLIAYSGVNYKDANIDPDPDNSKRGIAIYAQDVYAAAGAWKYTMDGSSWSVLDLTGGALHFLENDATVQVRFRYDVSLNVTDYATLSFYAWDGTNYGGSTYPYVAAVSGSRGGSSAYSTNATTYRIDVTYVNNRPVFSNTPIEVTIPNVGGYSPTGAISWTRVGDLSGIFNNLADPDANLLKRGGVKEKTTVNYGLIIYDAPTENGIWYYSATNQSGAVNNVAIRPSEINGFVLPHDYYIRFAPAYNRDISNISIKCRGIASTAAISVLSGGKDITFNSPTLDYTAADATITTGISHVNKAPVLLASDSLLYTLPTLYGDDVDNADNSGVSVKDIMDSAAFVADYSDPDITDGVVPATQKGIVLTSRGGNAAGSWQYKLSASDISWSTVGVNVTADVGLALSYSENVRIRFNPTSNADASANILIYAWDQTSGNSGSTINITTATKGDPNSISNNSRTIGLSVRYLNHRPYFNDVSMNAVTTPGNNDGNSGTTLRNILDVSGLDYKDRDTLDGRGIAIVSSSIPSDLSGIWQYRETTNDADWTNIVLTAGNVFFLRQTSSLTQVRFRPYVNPDGDKVAMLTVKAWDCTEFTNYGSVSSAGTTSSLSLGQDTATIYFNVEKIYYVPSLEGTITYATPVPANTTFSLSFADILNLFSIPGNDRAIAIVNTTTNGNGTWSYNVGGGSFNNITIAGNIGLVLNEASNLTIRYVNTPNIFYNPSFAFHLLDRTIYNNQNGAYPTTGQVLQNFDALPKGGTNYLSATNATFRLSITQVATAPTLKPIPVGTGRRRIAF